VRWELDWFEAVEEVTGVLPDKGLEENYMNIPGRYIRSVARYFVRMANQLLVEDENFGSENKGFVMLTADNNVRLRWCHKGRGAEDFIRLIADNLTISPPDAAASAEMPGPSVEGSDPYRTAPSAAVVGVAPPPAAAVPVKKFAEITKSVREGLFEVLEEREKLHEDRKRVARIFSSFALDGDLDAGIKLLDFAAEVESKVTGGTCALTAAIAAY